MHVHFTEIWAECLFNNGFCDLTVPTHPEVKSYKFVNWKSTEGFQLNELNKNEVMRDEGA